MNLTEEQRQRVTAWILQGAKLSEVQSRLQVEFGVKLTYMETRFLVDDLKLTPKDPDPPKTETPVVEPRKVSEDKKSAAGKNPVHEPAARAASGVSVTVDQIARPGAVVSGKVMFTDGQTAEWLLDQTGRLGVVPVKQGYKPSAAAVKEFQAALQNELARMGF
jgi:hypothetical protein